MKKDLLKKIFRLKKKKFYYLYYHSGMPCKENYTPEFENGVLRGKLEVTPKKAYELKESSPIDNLESTALVKNYYEVEGYQFIGWYARRRIDRVWKWYCIDGSWRTTAELENDMKIKRYYFSDCEKISNLCSKNGEHLVMEAQWQKNGYLKENNSLYYLYYHSGRPCKENYTNLLESGIIRGKLKVTKKGAYELKETFPLDNSQNTALLKNYYEVEGYQFVGWYARKMINKIWKWYCTDGSWNTTDELKKNSKIKNYCFLDCEPISNLCSEEGEYLIMEAQWQKEEMIGEKNE